MPKKFGLERGGLSRFSVENYLSHNAVNFRGWRESFSVSFILGIDKVWTRGGGRQYQDFPSNFFCLTVPEEFLGEHFRVSLNSGMGNFLLQRVMSRFSIFYRIFFCLTVLKSFVGEPFCAVFHKIFGSEKFYA